MVEREYGGLSQILPCHSWARPSSLAVKYDSALTHSCAISFEAGSRSIWPKTCLAFSTYSTGVYHSFSPVKMAFVYGEGALVVMSDTRALACSTRISNLSSGRAASFCHFED